MVCSMAAARPGWFARAGGTGQVDQVDVRIEQAYSARLW
jgi:hypothetical protein